MASFNADIEKSNRHIEPGALLVLMGCRVLGVMVSSAILEGIGAYSPMRKPVYQTTPYLGPFQLTDGSHQFFKGLLIGTLP